MLDRLDGSVDETIEMVRMFLYGLIKRNLATQLHIVRGNGVLCFGPEGTIFSHFLF